MSKKHQWSVYSGMAFLFIVMMLLFTTNRIRISAVEIKVKTTPDTLMFNKAMLQVYFSVRDVSLKQDSILKNQETIIKLYHAR
jgi:hypothetical protein